MAQTSPYSSRRYSVSAGPQQGLPSFNIPPSTSGSNAPQAPAPTPFRAPAHKHAHHLHSIPPREKSTRTLIIDHMLWVHARTRFSQARAELGMTDRTGGKASPNYTHRERPENYEESDEEQSDGEDVVNLKAREGGPGHTHDEDDEERLSKQDLVLARSLRLRAEGLEKVVAAMLDQPPPVHPTHEEDYLDSPVSPRAQSANGRDPPNTHTLPNGVRLRLALGTVVNDLFARQAPVPRHRENGSKKDTHSTHSSANSPTSVSTGSDSLPPALALLATISGAPGGFAQPAISARSQPLSPTGTSRYQGIYENSAFAPNVQSYPGSLQTPFQSQQQQYQPPPTPSLRARALYVDGADPSSANAPPQFRCPRHLHTGCEICVEAKSSVGTKVKPGPGRSTSFGTEGSRSNAPTGVTSNGGGITGYQDGTGVGSGLARPGMDGSVLRRKLELEPIGAGKHTGAGNTKLSELICRFIRLSALVSCELGREAKEDLGIDDSSSDQETTAGSKRSFFSNALRPSREWYMLLAGLLTRATLEGYLTAGWTGIEPVECLLAVGLGCAQDPVLPPAVGSSDFEQDDVHTRGRGLDADLEGEFEEFDPDELPCLLEAARMLFPALRNGGSGFVKGAPEAEFEAEMDLRLRRFYDIPSSTPDVATHMEDLAWRYPAEPVERAGLRFVEAVAKWRGKPELETYKKEVASTTTSLDGTGAGMESLVHSSPVSPETARTEHANPTASRPPIERYFLPPQSASNWARSKRPRSPGGPVRPQKRTR